MVPLWFVPLLPHVQSHPNMHYPFLAHVQILLNKLNHSDKVIVQCTLILMYHYADPILDPEDPTKDWVYYEHFMVEPENQLFLRSTRTYPSYFSTLRPQRTQPDLPPKNFSTITTISLFT